MSDNRKFKGRSDFLQSLIGGLVAAYGSDIGIDPEFEVAKDADAFVKSGKAGPLSPEQNKAWTSGALDKPFKPQGFWAKGNAAVMNKDYLADRLSAERDLANRLSTLKYGSDLDLNRAVEEDKIKREYLKFSEPFLTEEQAKRKGIDVVGAKGIVPKPENIDSYNTKTVDEALKAALAGFRKSTDVDTEAATKARIANLIAKETAGSDINTAKNQAEINNLLSGGALERVPQTLENLDYGAQKFIRNAEAEYLNSLLQPMSPGSVLLNKGTMKPAYSVLSDEQRILQASGMPGAAVQQPEARAQSTGKVAISGGRFVTKDTSKASVPNISPKPVLPEPSTGTVLQTPPIKEGNTLSNSIGALGSTLGSATDITAKSLGKVPKEILLRLLDPYYIPAGRKIRTKP
jgi:hypothetical protein